MTRVTPIARASSLTPAIRLHIIFPSYRSWALVRGAVVVHVGRDLWWLLHRRWPEALAYVSVRGGQVRQWERE